jgi:hypothetical protein
MLKKLVAIGVIFLGLGVFIVYSSSEIMGETSSAINQNRAAPDYNFEPAYQNAVARYEQSLFTISNIASLAEKVGVILSVSGIILIIIGIGMPPIWKKSEK